MPQVRQLRAAGGEQWEPRGCAIAAFDLRHRAFRRHVEMRRTELEPYAAQCVRVRQIPLRCRRE